jgi:hypothetical protein
MMVIEYDISYFLTCILFVNSFICLVLVDVFDATVAIYSETDVFYVFALYFNSSRVTHIVSKFNMY